MNGKRIATIASIALVIPLAGCGPEIAAGSVVVIGVAASEQNYGRQVEFGPGHGNAVKHNLAVQIIDPVPADAALGPPEMEGKRAARAIDRYQRGEETPLRRVTTTSGDIGGNSGSK